MPSGIPISRSRILSTSPRSPSNSSLGGCPSPSQAPSAREAETPGVARGHVSQSSTLSAGSSPRQEPTRDNDSYHLTRLRTVTRSVSERSIDRQSVDSAQLALKLATSDFGDGDSDRQSSQSLRFLQDEPPPFVTSRSNVTAPPDDAHKRLGGPTPSWKVGMTSDIREIDLSDLPDDPLPFEQDHDGPADVQPTVYTQQPSAASLVHTPIRQIATNPAQTSPRSDPATSKSSSMNVGPRHKPIGSTSIRQRNASTIKASTTATPRSASAQELSRMTATSKKLGTTSSPSTLGRSAGATHALTSSTSSREHYPVEAYMVPHIAEYKPTNGDWENTIIPTHARGPNFLANADSEGATGDDDLVTEWTPDGKPIRVVKVSERSARTDMGRGDSARTGPAEKQELVGGGL